MNEKDKKKWMAVFTSAFMSSEERGSDSDDGCFVKKELPWRSQRVTNFFAKLDEAVDGSKSRFAKKQTRQRVLVAEQSLRRIPSGKWPSWALTVPQDK